MKPKSSILPKKTNHKTAIIAEIGVNHNNDPQILFSLIKQCHEAGADFVKFQVWKQDKWNDIEILRMDKDLLMKAINYCNKIGINWFATGFDKESLDLLESFGQKIWKIPSSLNTNQEFIDYIKTKKGTFLISTGYLDLDEIKKLLSEFMECSFVLLHCVAEYPSRLEDANINIAAIIAPSKCGLSCHYPGIAPALAAVSLGATVIEKHVTINRNMKGPDHKSSITIDELKELVKLIREIDIALGNPIKEPTQSEIDRKETIQKRFKEI